MRKGVNIMTRIALNGLAAAAIVAGMFAAAPAAYATPSCVAQSIQSEHDLYGTAWGHDTIAFLASHPEVLEEFGFGSFGELARFGASQDPAACPPDL
jgi:hypothetical protein